MAQRILMIDDEADIRTVARLSLERIGRFEVHLAGSGQEGIESARAIQPDVILLDVVMPNLDGLATLEALRARAETRAIPVIFMTASVAQEQVDAYLAAGAIGVVHKPFDPTRLPAQVRALLG